MLFFFKMVSQKWFTNHRGTKVGDEFRYGFDMHDYHLREKKLEALLMEAGHFWFLLNAMLYLGNNEYAYATLCQDVPNPLFQRTLSKMCY